MAIYKSTKKVMLLALTITVLFTFTNTEKVISDEVLSRERLQNRVNVFNDWYSKLNPSSKVEARLMEDDKIHLFSKTNIKAEDAYLVFNKNMTINSQLIYDTQLGSLIKSLEEEYGWDDYLKLVFYLINEIANPESQWKPYLDLLPRQPDSIAFDFWKRKLPIEEEFMHLPILSKINIKIFFIHLN